jgi:hypothetical protein
MVAEALERAGRGGVGAGPVGQTLRADLDALSDEFAGELRLLAAQRASQALPAGESAGIAAGVAGHARAVGGTVPRFLRYEGSGLDMSRYSLSGRAGDLAVQVGRDAVWWGPGFRGAFLLSDNAGPLDSLSLSLTSGRFRVVKLIAPLADPERYLYGLRLDWQARNDLRIGFGEILVGPGGPSALYALNIVPGVAYAISHHLRAAYNDNYSFSLDFDWRVRAGTVVYGELYVDDLVISDPYRHFPDRIAGTLGVYLADPFGDGRTGLRFEHSRATNWIYATSNPATQPVRSGRAVGHWCAPDCELWSVSLIHRLAPRASVVVGYDLIRKGEGRLGETWTNPDDAWARYYLSGVVETTHVLRAAASWWIGDLRTVLTVGRSAASNAAHVSGATRQDWFVLWEASYGF